MSGEWERDYKRDLLSAEAKIRQLKRTLKADRFGYMWIGYLIGTATTCFSLFLR